MIIILKKIFAVFAALVLLPVQAFAYDVINLPDSMPFAEALGIYDVNDIASATICDLDANIYKNLDENEIRDFYYASSNVTVWRKVNPTPFRGICVNFTTTSGSKISYYFESGIQIGTYGTDNYICYMPAKTDAVNLSYLQSEFLDKKDTAYGGVLWNVCTTKDFLKLPDAEWAKHEMRTAASKSLLPYEFTGLYGRYITREQLTELLANFIVVYGNYSSMESYMTATGTEYINGFFSDCSGRADSINQLYALGIITGKTDTEFDPDGRLTRQELATLMTRLADKYMYVSSANKCVTSDKPAVADWAKYYVGWNLDHGIMSLDDSNKFYPYNPVTVEQAITTLSRLYSIVNK